MLEVWPRQDKWLSQSGPNNTDLIESR